MISDRAAVPDHVRAGNVVDFDIFKFQAPMKTCIAPGSACMNPAFRILSGRAGIKDIGSRRAPQISTRFSKTMHVSHR